MKRIKLKVAYDGTEYCGWQIQPNGITVEEVLNHHLSQLLKEEIIVIGASRTDSGVHALGNIAVFDTNARMPAEKVSYALNQRLPKDIRIQESCQVENDFHPRYCKSTKTYEYQILNRKFELPTQSRYSHFEYRSLDIDKMQKAGQYLVGEHDFKSFCSARTQVVNTVRIIYQMDITQKGEMVSICMKGNGFLYNMVRIIVGTLLRVGTGFYSPEQVKEILEAKDRLAAGPKAPAQGLTLIGIDYEPFVKGQDIVRKS